MVSMTYRVVLLIKYKNMKGSDTKQLKAYHSYPQLLQWNCFFTFCESNPNIATETALDVPDTLFMLDEPQVGHFGIFDCSSMIFLTCSNAAFNCIDCSSFFCCSISFLFYFCSFLLVHLTHMV